MVRSRDGGFKAFGAFILSASHNPGGIDEDFGEHRIVVLSIRARSHVCEYARTTLVHVHFSFLVHKFTL